MYVWYIFSTTSNTFLQQPAQKFLERGNLDKGFTRSPGPETQGNKCVKIRQCSYFQCSSRFAAASDQFISIY